MTARLRAIATETVDIVECGGYASHGNEFS
jgi:hypothetical protein